jgi:anaerobic selenocysteine-containing dehydrogenase
MDFILGPSGMSFDDFREVGVLEGRAFYGSHLDRGFPTPSGKAELYSSRLQQWGFDPLPSWQEPEGLDANATEEYPLVLTSWKPEEYRHSGGRQITSLRSRRPEPLLWLHPETAKRFGLGEGDMAVVETPGGSIRQKVHVTERIRPGVVGVEFGWWFPERGPQEEYGWSEGNINVLTQDHPQGREMGTPNLRGIFCRIRHDRS